MTGTVKTIIETRGFGFIKAEDGSEIFFHRSGCVGDFYALAAGDQVTYESEQSTKGPRAKDVKLVPVGLAGPAA